MTISSQARLPGPGCRAAAVLMLAALTACGGGSEAPRTAACPPPPAIQPAVHAAGAGPDGVREGFLITLGLAAAGKVGGLIVGGLIDWIFGGDDDAAPSARAADCPPPAYDFAAHGPPAGIGYQLFRIDHTGQPHWVDPDSMVFRTGDAAVVGFMTNLPGIVTAYNRNPAGRTARIGQWVIAGVGGERLPRDGAFRFVDEPGEELLVLAFQPCRPAGLAVDAGYRADAVATLPGCDRLAGTTGLDGGRLEAIVYDPSAVVRDGRTRIRLAAGAGRPDLVPDPVVVPIRLIHR